MELDGLIDGEDNEETSDGEVGRIGEEMVHTTHPRSLVFPYMLFFAEACVCGVCSRTRRRVWGYFHPRPLDIL